MIDNFSFVGDPRDFFIDRANRDPYRGFYNSDHTNYPATSFNQTVGRRSRPREFIIPIHVEGRDEPHVPQVHHHIDLTGDNYNNNGIHNHSRTRRRHLSGTHGHNSGGSKSSDNSVSHFPITVNSKSSSTTTDKSRSTELSDDLIDLCMYDDMWGSGSRNCYTDESLQVSRTSLKRAGSECIITDVTTKASVEDSCKSVTPTPSYTVYSLLKAELAKDGRLIDYIRGDGNCFFRALSKDIYGSEEFYQEVRQAVVDLIEKFSKEFEQFLDSGMSIGEHIKDMRKDATWATSAEIYAAATLLQRDIYVLSPDHTGEAYNWMLFRPRFIYTRNTSYHPCFITICHTHGNHYDRITPKSGNCNCDKDPPVLSGVQAYVDLTK